MPYVSPIVGYFGRLTATGNYRMYDTCCATPDDYRPDDDFTPLQADNFMDGGGDGRCEACGEILTDDPKQLVHAAWNAPTPTVRRDDLIARFTAHLDTCDSACCRGRNAA